MLKTHKSLLESQKSDDLETRHYALLKLYKVYIRIDPGWVDLDLILGKVNFAFMFSYIGKSWKSVPM